MGKINKEFIGYIVLILIVIITSVVGFYIAKKIQNAEQPTIVTQPSQYPDYDAIKGKKPDLKIKIARITPEGGHESDRPATSETLDEIYKRYKVVGILSRTYLYIEALVDYSRPLTAWDDISFSINGFGGHLIRDENLLPVPPGESSVYLYDFRSVSYYPTIQDKEKKENRHNNLNLFYLFQDTSVLNIRTFISSARPGRILKEVIIYYECYEGSDCGIEEIE